MDEKNKAGKLKEMLIGSGRAAKNGAAHVKKATADAGLAGETLLRAVINTGIAMGRAGKDAVRLGKNAAGAAQEGLTRTRDAALQKLDHNGDGKIDAFDVITLSLRVPGVSVDRARFLRQVLTEGHSPETAEAAVAGTPAGAGFTPEEIERIADEVIDRERNLAAGISAALGMPGGAAMAATIPADIVQYYGCILRASQKLLYLYGFPDIGTDDREPDPETLSILTLCLGVIYGAAGANNAVKGLAKALTGGMEKQLVRNALYPAARSAAEWFGVKMTEQIFAGVLKNAVPVVGGVVGGGITFASFKPCCLRLKAVLTETVLADPGNDAPDGNVSAPDPDPSDSENLC